MELKVLVTGGSGFIGRNFLLRLPKTWSVVAPYYQSSDFPQWLSERQLHHIHPIKCDLCSSISVIDVVRQFGATFDICVYFAANGDPAYSVKNPIDDLQKNTISLINCLNNFNIEKIIYFSSGAVYTGLSGLVNPTVALRPQLPYAISKWASEHYIQSYMLRGTVSNYVNVRFFGAFGPYEPERKIYSKLIKRFLIEKAPQFTLRGDGKNLIDAMYVDDTIEGILAMVKSQHTNLTVDFCSGMPTSLNNLVQIAATTCDIDHVQIEHEGNVPEYINFTASPTQFQELFHFLPQISLVEGLQRFAKHIKENNLG